MFSDDEINSDDVKLIEKLNNESSYQIFNNYQYKKPKPFSFLTSFPNDLQEYGKIVFNRNYLKTLLQVHSIVFFFFLSIFF